MVLDTSLLNTQQYKVRIGGKVEQSRERSNALPYTSVVVAIEKGAFWSLLITVAKQLLHSNTWDHLTMCKQMSFGSFKILSMNYAILNNTWYMYEHE